MARNISAGKTAGKGRAKPASGEQTTAGEQPDAAIAAAVDDTATKAAAPAADQGAEAQSADAAPEPAATDPAQLTAVELARAVLDRSIRPLVSHARILAEAVIAAEDGKAKKSKLKSAAAGKKKNKDGGKVKKNKKLAKIPKQKSDRKPAPKADK